MAFNRRGSEMAGPATHQRVICTAYSSFILTLRRCVSSSSSFFVDRSNIDLLSRFPILSHVTLDGIIPCRLMFWNSEYSARLYVCRTQRLGAVLSSRTDYTSASSILQNLTSRQSARLASIKNKSFQHQKATRTFLPFHLTTAIPQILESQCEEFR